MHSATCTFIQRGCMGWMCRREQADQERREREDKARKLEEIRQKRRAEEAAKKAAPHPAAACPSTHALKPVAAAEGGRTKQAERVIVAVMRLG